MFQDNEGLSTSHFFCVSHSAVQVGYATPPACTREDRACRLRQVQNDKIFSSHRMVDNAFADLSGARLTEGERSSGRANGGGLGCGAY